MKCVMLSTCEASVRSRVYSPSLSALRTCDRWPLCKARRSAEGAPAATSCGRQSPYSEVHSAGCRAGCNVTVLQHACADHWQLMTALVPPALLAASAQPLAPLCQQALPPGPGLQLQAAHLLPPTGSRPAGCPLAGQAKRPRGRWRRRYVGPPATQGAQAAAAAAAAPAAARPLLRLQRRRAAGLLVAPGPEASGCPVPAAAARPPSRTLKAARCGWPRGPPSPLLPSASRRLPAAARWRACRRVGTPGTRLLARHHATCGRTKHNLVCMLRMGSSRTIAGTCSSRLAVPDSAGIAHKGIPKRVEALRTWAWAGCSGGKRRAPAAATPC